MSRNLLKENTKRLVDNFDLVSKNLDFSQPNSVYFIQIIKRFKDNPNCNRNVGNYHAGAWYLSHYLVHSVQELMSLKPQIVKECNANNARAYISVNPRDEVETSRYVSAIQAKHPGTNNAEAIAYGTPKGHIGDKGKFAGVRPRLHLDIDSPKTDLWNAVLDVLKFFSIKPVFTYITPSKGYHIILPDKSDPNLSKFMRTVQLVDGGVFKGRKATVGADVDAKIILYSYVDTPGY